MTLYGRATRFIAIKTLLVGRCCVRGNAYVAPSCMLSGVSQQRHRLLQSAGLSILQLNRCGSGSRRGGTSLTGVRKPRAPMIGPELPPAPPPPTLYDADGNELSKPTKRKVAIVVGYVGTAFHGWQQSTDAQNVRTVEGELETALWKAGAIADSNYGDLNKIGWGRTSRTDKGVHASKTVAAAKLLLPQETFTAAGMSQYGKDKLNENLPDDIRCFSVSKVPKSFRGREECTLREYTYYLPRELLPDDEALVKFRELLKLFVGTHSFHNYASTKGRQLKEVRKRVKASIDLKKSGGKPAPGPEAAGGAVSASAPGSEEDAAAAAAGGGDAGDSGSKKRRWVSKDEWRTYRYKKKSAADQKADDAWFGKQSAAGAAPEESVGAAAAAVEPPVVVVAGVEQQAGGDEGPESSSPRSVEGGTSGDAVGSADAGSAAAVAAVATPKDVASAGKAAGVEGTVVKSDGGEGEAGGDAASAVSAPGAQEAAGVGGEDEGPEKQILLRELRTSIYRCEALDGIVSYTRPGQDTPDEFVRIDIRGKAFVYNQIRLMIGGALGEARGDLWSGFVEAALKTPYKLRVPLAPAEGLVLESQAFTRHTNALVLDPRDLGSIGGTLAVWGESKEGNAMKTTGRLQTLLTREQLREAERWSDEHILPAVADAWEARGTAKLFLEAVEKFFVGQQQEEPLLKAIAENLSEISESERRAEEKYNKFRVLAKERGSTKYKDLLPKSIATGIICKFRLLPGNKVSAIQRGVVERMNKGELPPLAEVEEILAFIEKIGVDQVALDGGFVAPDVEGGDGGDGGGGATATSAATPAAEEVATTT
ncbi:unnamed protein product [Ectocarpus sp. 12 AP-2014]